MKAYENPTITTLGTVVELTEIDKCGGSGDAYLPEILSTEFSHPCE
jgi:hypothetical protein